MANRSPHLQNRRQQRLNVRNARDIAAHEAAVARAEETHLRNLRFFPLTAQERSDIGSRQIASVR